jgi:IS5 family transposase
MSTDYNWKESYRAAIVETDDKKLRERIQAAQAAIDTRLQDLQMDHGGTPEERLAIADALDGLNILRRELQTRSSETGSSKV